MATKSLGTLTLDLVAKTAGFVQGMDRAERASAKWKRQVERDIKKVGSTIGTGLAIAATAAAAGLAVLVQRSRETIDAQAKTAQQLRTTTESVANLTRAGELAGVSLKQVEVAGRTLDVALGKASQGVGRQADAFKLLKLNADDLAKLPLDQRILQINQALKENVSETERAAIAADLFGTRNGAAIQQLQPEVIARAAEEMKVFGLNLSDVDAAKVEAANDSLSRIGLAVDGLGQQLTVAIAPALEAVGDAFFEYAKDAGGANKLVADSFDGVVDAIAFTADAADGIGRAFKIAANTAIVEVTYIARNAAEKIYALINLVNKIPGVNFSETERDIAEFVRVQSRILQEASGAIKESIETPLAGNAIRDAFEKAKLKADEAAKAAVAARNAASGPEGGASNVVYLEEVKVTAQKRKTSEETQRLITLNRDYNNLVESLRTQEEKLTDQLIEQLDIVGQIQISDEKRAALRKRIVDAAGIEAPKVGGLSPEVGGAYSELDRLNEESKRLEDWYSEELNRYQGYLDNKLISEQEYNSKALELKQAHEESIAKIEQARQQASLIAAEDLFGNLAGLAKTFAGEQSDSYKILFAAEKAAAIARSIIAIQTALAEAAASGPFPANLAAMATVAAQTASIVATIASTTIGQAHDGLMSVPKTGTYILEKGERVVSAETTAKMDKQLDNMSGGNIRIVNAYDDSHLENYLGSDSGERVIMNHIRRNARTIRSLSA